MGGSIFLGGLSTFLYFYNYYAGLVDDKLARGAYSNTSRLFAMPQTLSVGDKITSEEIANALVAAGYSTARENRVRHGSNVFRNGAVGRTPTP